MIREGGGGGMIRGRGDKGGGGRGGGGQRYFSDKEGRSFKTKIKTIEKRTIIDEMDMFHLHSPCVLSEQIDMYNVHLDNPLHSAFNTIIQKTTKQ